jgi:hypothetical protein
MTYLSLARSHKLLVFWGVLVVVTTWTQLLFVNNYINPDSGRLFNAAQLQLQFAFTAEAGMEVLRSWGPGGAERYLQVIWVDVAFALSYGPFFYMLIKRLAPGSWWAGVPLLEMGSNLIETAIEVYWVINHSPDNMMPGLFFFHSVVAAIKWLVLVPTYFIHSGLLIRNALRNRGPGGLAPQPS